MILVLEISKFVWRWMPNSSCGATRSAFTQWKETEYAGCLGRARAGVIHDEHFFKAKSVS